MKFLKLIVVAMFVVAFALPLVFKKMSKVRTAPDGIPFLPTPEFAFTTYQIRTAPLWALRTRNRLMHDGLSFTLQEAILRHEEQATNVTNNYNDLSAAQKSRLMAFLNSL